MILRAAVRFLSRRPFRTMSVGELMADTALSRPAFYQYFRDLHDLMESLLDVVRDAILAKANPWIAGEGEPLEALHVALRGVVEAGVEHGAVLRAVTEAAPFDQRLERAWRGFMRRWDDVVTARIEAQQVAGLVAPFDARPVAMALNAMDASTVVQAFGRRPHADPEAVLAAIHRIWTGALYSRSGLSTSSP
jgi:AcrR family transcriptional regulator